MQMPSPARTASRVSPAPIEPRTAFASWDEAKQMLNVWLSTQTPHRARQDLGMIDTLGRAWRYRPHTREAEWLTTGTVVQGALAMVFAMEVFEATSKAKA